MAGWIFFLIFAGLAVAWFVSFSYQWRNLERLVTDLAAGPRPNFSKSFAWPRFTRLARRLEEISGDEQRLRDRLAEDFQAILASMAEGVMVVGDDHSIRLVNDSFRGLFGLTGDPVGRTVLGAVRDASVEELVSETIRTGEPQTRDVSILPGGTRVAARHFAVNAAPLRRRDGDEGGVVAVFHETTRLRQLEEMRRDFVANVSHELRTPLSIFQGYLENLLDYPDLPREEVAGILGIMRRHSLRLNALLEDLLTLARLEARQEKLELEWVDLKAFLSGVLEDWQGKFAEKDLTVRLELAPGLPPRMEGDKYRLAQVLNNLLENAAKFTPAGGTITLSAALERDEMVLQVSDTGAGIPPADLPHIFERFYRVEKARSREGGGTGLGLSIVKHIAALHGGSVSAESTFGEGTTITLRLLARVAGED